MMREAPPVLYIELEGPHSSYDLLLYITVTGSRNITHRIGGASLIIRLVTLYHCDRV
jgi:hypothetical protein